MKIGREVAISYTISEDVARWRGWAINLTSVWRVPFHGKRGLQIVRNVICLSAGLAVLALTACGSSAASLQTPPHSVAPSGSPVASSSAPSTPSTALPQWAGSSLYTDAQGYRWELTWSFIPSPASDAASYTDNDSPSQATLRIPVSGQIDLTNMTDRNAVPPAEVDIFALYPARSPLCSYLSEGPTPPLVRFNGTPHPACPVLLMSGLYFGNATVAQGGSFSPQLEWNPAGAPVGVLDVPYNVFTVSTGQEQAVIADVNTVRPLALLIAVADAGSNPLQCSFADRQGDDTYVVDSYPQATVTCVQGEAG
jgi:hypothetical protein